MMEEITARSVSLSTLLDGIADGEVVLPDFQRDFDWSDGDVLAIVATVLRGWPAGSLLLMRGAPGFFDIREFENAPQRSEKVKNVVLDGQQRLTALYNAFRGAGPSVFGIDLNLVSSYPPEVDALEEAIFFEPRARWDSLRTMKHQVENLIVPLSVIEDPTSFFEWRDAAVDLIAPVDRPEIRRQLTRAYKNLLQAASQYAFPAVLLENDLPSEAVARIFERVNRTGQRLGTFDLLVARSYSKSWNLRHRYDELRRSSERVEQFLGEDGTPILQCISLRSLGDVRQQALMTMTKELIQDRWDRGAAGFDQALEFVRSLGVEEPDDLPHRALLLPLATLGQEFDLLENSDILSSWFWARAFAQDYAVASSTKASSDYKILSRRLAGDDATLLPSSLFVEDFVRANKKQNGALWRAFRCLLNLRASSDLITEDSIRSGGRPVALEAVSRTAGTAIPVWSQLLSSRGSSRTVSRYSLAEMESEGLLNMEALDEQFIDASMLQLSNDKFLAARGARVLDFVNAELTQLLDVAVRAEDA